MRPYWAYLCVAAPLWALDPSTGKQLVFSDDFNDGTVDATKWVTSGSPEVITFAKLASKDGKENKALRIGLRKGENMIQTNSLTTKGKFEQAFGYFEASIRMNASKGHSGVFRLGTKDDKELPAGALIFECTGADSIHPWARTATDSGQHDYRPETKSTQYLKSGESSKKFNTYGLLWTDKSYAWFINSKQVMKLDRADFKKPMIISLTHRITEAQRADLNLKNLPDDVDFDWVKAWK